MIELILIFLYLRQEVCCLIIEFLLMVTVFRSVGGNLCGGMVPFGPFG